MILIINLDLVQFTPRYNLVIKCVPVIKEGYSFKTRHGLVYTSPLFIYSYSAITVGHAYWYLRLLTKTGCRICSKNDDGTNKQGFLNYEIPVTNVSETNHDPK